jgi:hypothetical protein
MDWDPIRPNSAIGPHALDDESVPGPVAEFVAGLAVYCDRPVRIDGELAKFLTVDVCSPTPVPRTWRRGAVATAPVATVLVLGALNALPASARAALGRAANPSPS